MKTPAPSWTRPLPCLLYTSDAADDTPFAREEELAEKTARLKELNILLKVDEKDKTLIDSVPDEGEEAPQRKVMGLER